MVNMRTFYIKGVVATTPTSQKIIISPMGVAWKEWTQKFNYNPNNFGKVPPLLGGLSCGPQFIGREVVTAPQNSGLIRV